MNDDDDKYPPCLERSCFQFLLPIQVPFDSSEAGRQPGMPGLWRAMAGVRDQIVTGSSPSCWAVRVIEIAGCLQPPFLDLGVLRGISCPRF